METKIRSEIRAVAVGAAGGVIIALAATAALAAVSVALGRYSAVGAWAAMAAMCLAGFVAGALTGSKSRKSPLPKGLLAALAADVLLCLSAACIPGEGGTAWPCLACLCAGALGAILGERLRKNR